MVVAVAKPIVPLVFVSPLVPTAGMITPPRVVVVAAVKLLVPLIVRVLVPGVVLKVIPVPAAMFRVAVEDPALILVCPATATVENIADGIVGLLVRSAYDPLNSVGLFVKSSYEPEVATVANVGVPVKLPYAPSKTVEIVPAVTFRPLPTITPPSVVVVEAGNVYAAGNDAQDTPVPVDLKYCPEVPVELLAVSVPVRTAFVKVGAVNVLFVIV